jgi:LDH2 family malate/lactate/ureidoglycolate dehydrogenase
MVSRDPTRISRLALEEWTADTLRSAGLEGHDARLAARILVRTDSRGFKTHGLARLKSYLEKIADGEVAARAVAQHSVTGSLCNIEAGGALGQISGPQAIDAGLELASQTPVAVVRLNNAGHLGALGIHVLRAAEAGMVALMFQATPPIMGVPGAQRALIGNNPLAMAAPRSNGPPVVVDMACCVAARGNILLAARTGEPIPEGWALDSGGAPTTDAEDALMGSLLPFGGHKGMGLAMIVEVLAGSLAGVEFQKSLNPEGGWRSGSGHLNALIIVFNPDLVTGRALYESHMAAWTDHVLAEGGPGARIPGQRAHDSEQDAETCGVPLSPSIVEELVSLGRSAGIAFPTPDPATVLTSDTANETGRNQ